MQKPFGCATILVLLMIYITILHMSTTACEVMVYYSLIIRITVNIVRLAKANKIDFKVFCETFHSKFSFNITIFPIIL